MADRLAKHRAVMDLSRDEWLDALGDRPRRIPEFTKPLSLCRLQPWYHSEYGNRRGLPKCSVGTGSSRSTLSTCF